MISDKISRRHALRKRLLLHVVARYAGIATPRGAPDDETRAIASEIVRHNLFDRVHIGLDFLRRLYQPCRRVGYRYRNMRKDAAARLLEPTDQLRQLEASGDIPRVWRCWKSRKSCRGRPSGKMYCQRHDTPAGSQWLDSVRASTQKRS